MDGKRACLDDRVAPIVEADWLGEELGAEAMAVAPGAVDRQLEVRHQPASASLAAPLNSASKTSSADCRNAAAPSGWRHAPRPFTIAAHRCRRSRSPLSAVASASRVTAAARLPSPKKQGPHCAALSPARWRMMRALSATGLAD